MSTLSERLRDLGEEWKLLAGDLSTPAQRTLWEAADDLLAIASHHPRNDETTESEGNR